MPDFKLNPQVATLAVPGAWQADDMDWLSIYQHGVNLDLDTATGEILVWPGDAAYVLQDGARTLEAVSTSAADATSSTGARTLLVEGLDADHVVTTESISLAGTVTVTSSTTFLRVNDVKVATAGSGGVPAGAISVLTETTGDLQATLLAGVNSAQMAQFTVPAAHKGFIYGWSGQGNSAAGTPDTLELQVKETGGVFIPQSQVQSNRGIGPAIVNFDWPLEVPAQATVRIAATAGANDADIHAGFQMVCIPLAQIAGGD